MKIAIDIRCLQDKRHSGVQEYLLQLLENLLGIDKKNQYLLFSSGRRSLDHQDIQVLIKKYPNLSAKHLKIPNRLLTIFWRLSNWPNLDKFLDYPDVFFAPNLNILPRNILRKTIITFHDLSFRRFPEFFSLKSRLWHWFIGPGFLARESKKIIAVSDSTKEDIKEFYKIRESKIQVIPLGKDRELREIRDNKGRAETIRKIKEVKEKYHLPDKFILYLGTLEPRKNIIGIIRAYNLLRKTKRFAEYKLVLAGPRGWLWKKIIQVAKKSPHSHDIIFSGAVDRKERVYLYALATIFVYPSFLEGFGLPPLEAMSCGLPVIASNRSSLPSVVGDAAILVDPYRIDEIMRAIEEVLGDKQLYDILGKAGIERAKYFSWQKTARETLKHIT